MNTPHDETDAGAGAGAGAGSAAGALPQQPGEAAEPTAPADSGTAGGPVVIAAFEGWNDAGDAASTVIEHLQLSWDTNPLAELGSDDYYDYQVSRPTLRLVDGVSRRIDWPATRLSVCRPESLGRDLVLVQGPEPNMRWRSFCAELLEHVQRLGASTVITLGALLADTAHTRPVPVTGTAYDQQAASRYGLQRSRYEGPTGIVGVLQDACVQAGVPAVSIWAAVPHYVSHPPSPKASLALLHKLEDVLETQIPLGALPERAEQWQRTVSEMAEEDEEIREYVRSLEERGDAELTVDEDSGDKIAAEFERYLRRRGHGGQGGAEGHSGSGA